MQTFLPYKSYVKSARCLDNKRLGKQRVEAMQILYALTRPEYGWKNHPAVKMWKGYERALCNYARSICLEWIRRGFKDTVLDKIESIRDSLTSDYQFGKPKFVESNKFIRAHRSNLLRKDKAYYSKFKWNVPDDLEYIWPVK